MTATGRNDSLSDARSAAELRTLSDAARRALAEAEARRQAAQQTPALPKEEGGRDGPEPIRYGDWERNGIVSDF